jgi:hypothetical protein
MKIFRKTISSVCYCLAATSLVSCTDAIPKIEILNSKDAPAAPISATPTSPASGTHHAESPNFKIKSRLTFLKHEGVSTKYKLRGKTL